MKKSERPLPLCQISLDHPVTKRFRYVPFPEISNNRKGFAILVLLFGSIGIAGAMTSLFPVLRDGLNSLVVIVCGFFVGIVAIINYSIAFALSDMRKQRDHDTGALGEPAQEEHYVGICFYEAIIEREHDSSLDCGWLSIREGRLCLRSYASSFKLPMSLIESIRLVPTDRNSTMSLPRVVVRWRHPDGVLESMVLEVRVGNSRRDIRKKTQELHQWLLDDRDTVAVDIDLSSLPIRSSEIEQAVSFRSDRVNWTDLAVALGMLIGVSALILGLGDALQNVIPYDFSSVLGFVLVFFGWNAYRLVLAKRQVDRKKKSR